MRRLGGIIPFFLVVATFVSCSSREAPESRDIIRINGSEYGISEAQIWYPMTIGVRYVDMIYMDNSVKKRLSFYFSDIDGEIPVGRWTSYSAAALNRAGTATLDSADEVFYNAGNSQIDITFSGEDGGDLVIDGTLTGPSFDCSIEYSGPYRYMSS